MPELDILNLLLVLLAAWAGGALSVRLGYPAILGELFAGIILGPGLLGLLDNSDMVNVLAEVGIILLMVYIGMEIDFRDLKKSSWPGLLAAIGGFVLPFLLGYYTIILFGGDQMAAVFVAIAVGVTSLATKSRILVDLKLLNTRIAYVMMAGALISDTLALVIFAGIVSFVDAGSVNIVELAIVAGKAILFFVVTIFIGIYLLPMLGKYLERAGIRNRTLHFTMMLVLAFGFAELAELGGMHSILGAFMAGLFIRDGVFNRKVSREINRVFYDVSIGFMAPIFFVSAGFQVSLQVLQTDLLLLTTVITVATFGKIVGTMLFYLPSGNGWREGITIGTGMNGRGAVEIVIAGIGLQMGIISAEIFSILVFMAIFTTATVPVLLTLTTNWLRKRGELVQTEGKKGYLILGAHALGLLIARHLKEQGPVCLIDGNKDLANAAQKAGFECVHGNVLKEETLSQANASGMGTFIGLTSNSEINLLAAQLAGETFFVPNKYVLLSHNEEGADIELLEPIGATTMFARKANLDRWIHALNIDKAEEATAEIDNEIKCRDWVRDKMMNDENVLPVLIQNTEGIYRPFQYSDHIVTGEKVFYLK